MVRLLRMSDVRTSSGNMPDTFVSNDITSAAPIMNAVLHTRFIAFIGQVK